MHGELEPRKDALDAERLRGGRAQLAGEQQVRTPSNRSLAPSASTPELAGHEPHGLHTPSTSHTLKGRPFSSCALCFVQRLVNYLETLVLLKHAPETDTTTALLATQDKGMSHVERQEQLSEF